MKHAVGIGPSLKELTARIQGTVMGPGSSGYEEARKAWNLTVDQHPALIVFAESAEDVLAAVEYANGEGLRIAVTATGHGVIRPADGALLLNLSRMNGVEVDEAAKTARVEGGVKWGAVLADAQAHGLTPLLGSSPDVGAVGYTLGGGMGWLARKFGLAADSVLAFEVVTSDGQLLRASAGENSDLFWGLRGGGGSLAIVTAMEIRLYAVTTIYGGNLFYGADQAKEVMTRYREWIANAPDELTSSIVLMNFPPVPVIPEFLRGKSFVIVRGCYVGEMVEGERLLKSWRDWRTPLIDDFKVMPFSDVALISNDPVDPIPGISSGTWLRELSDGAIDTLIDFGVGYDGPSHLTVTEVRHAGGAITRVDEGSAAYGNRDAQHVLQVIAMTPTPEMYEGAERHISALRGALKAYETGGAYLNFLEGKEAQQRVREAYSPQSFARLKVLKSQLDPHNVLAYSAAIVPENGAA